MRTHPIRIAALVCLAALAALPVAADVYARSRSSSGGDTPNSQMDMVAEVYASGEQAQVYIRESSNEMMKEGTYLYTPDGGRTVYLVDPKEETVSEIDIEGLLKFAGAILDSLGPVVNIEIADPEVKVLSDGPGPDMLNVKTREYKVESSYVLLMKILGMKRQNEVHEVSTIVTTQDLPDVAVGMWLRNDPPTTGNSQLDKLAQSAWPLAEGEAALKIRVDSTMTGKKGKQQQSWTEFEVVELNRNADGPPGGYGYPEHYTPIQMVPIATQETEEDKKKGRFGGLFKRDGGGG